METAKRNTSTPFSKPRKDGSADGTSFKSKDSRAEGNTKSPMPKLTMRSQLKNGASDFCLGLIRIQTGTDVFDMCQLNECRKTSTFSHEQ